MIKYAHTVAMLLLTTATASEFAPQEVLEFLPPIVEGKGSDWGWAIFGFMLGALIEIGANLGAL